MSDMIEYITNLIEAKNIDRLKVTLDKINLSKIPYMVGNKLISVLINFAAENGSNDSIIEIIKFINSHDEDGTQLAGTICNVLMIEEISDEGAKAILNAFPDIGMLELFDILMMKDSNSQCKRAADHIMEFRESPTHVYYALYNSVKADQIVNGYSNKMIREVLLREIEKKMVDVDIEPGWLLKNGDEKLYVDFEKVKNAYRQIPDSVLFSSMFYEYTKTLGVDLFKMDNNGENYTKHNFDGNMCDEIFITVYSISNLRQRLKLLDSMKFYFKIDQEIIEMDDIVSKIYGPINCGEFRCGPCCCRMLTCFEYPVPKSILDDVDVLDDEEYNNGIMDWFNGYCNFCHKRIKSRRYCIREPLAGGGWYGCFCSMECFDDHKKETTSNVPIEIRKICYKIFEENLMDNGIYKYFPEIM